MSQALTLTWNYWVCGDQTPRDQPEIGAIWPVHLVCWRRWEDVYSTQEYTARFFSLANHQYALCLLTVIPPTWDYKLVLDILRTLETKDTDAYW